MRPAATASTPAGGDTSTTRSNTDSQRLDNGARVAGRIALVSHALAPGSYNTPLNEKSERSVNAYHDTVYVDAMERVISKNQASCRRSTELLPFARKVESILACRRPKLRYFVGRSDEGVANFLRGAFSGSWRETMIRKAFGL